MRREKIVFLATDEKNIQNSTDKNTYDTV